jgi:hypothetical protein
MVAAMTETITKAHALVVITQALLKRNPAFGESLEPTTIIADTVAEVAPLVQAGPDDIDAANRELRTRYGF